MKTDSLLDRQARRLLNQLPRELPTLAVIGSTTFRHADSRATCIATGRLLARQPRLALITGGMSGTGEVLGRSFFEARRERGYPPAVFHVLPRGFRCRDYGVTLYAGANLGERCEVLGRVSRIYLAIERGRAASQTQK